jgi:hypothetical protein
MASIPKENNGRPPVTDIQVAQAYLDSTAHYDKVRQKKGPGIFLSRHEILGVLQEEFSKEFVDSVHGDPHNMEKELFDIITACIHGIVSIRSGLMHW